MQLLFKLLLFLLLPLLTLGCIGFLYQYSAELIDSYRYPAPGQLINIGGYNLHIQEYGDGPPTVVFDAGTGSFSAMWGDIPKEVATFTHAYTYDKAGLGWSDESPYPRTSATMVEELRSLLAIFGAPKPYILVGHSLGGGTVQLYANTYPDEVYGLILVDAGNEQLFNALTPYHLAFKRSMTGFTVIDKEQPTPACNSWHEQLFLQLTGNPWGQLFAEYTGINRLYLTYFYDHLENNCYRTTPAMRSRMLRNATFRTCSQEIAHYQESGAQLAAAENRFSNKPLTVIANGKGFFYNLLCHQITTPAETIFDQKVWPLLQKELAKRSSKSTFIVAKNSGHRIQDSEPELIVEAIRVMVAGYRKSIK